MAVTIEKKTGVGKSSVQDKVKGQELAAVESEEPVGEIVSSEPLANVGVTMGYTKNLGNYESVKISVSVHMPAFHTQESINDTFAEAEEWVNAKMATLLETLPTTKT